MLVMLLMRLLSTSATKLLSFRCDASMSASHTEPSWISPSPTKRERQRVTHAARTEAYGAADGNIDAMTERTGRMLHRRDGVADVAGEQRAVGVVAVQQFHGDDAEMAHGRIGGGGAMALAHDHTRTIRRAVADFPDVGAAVHGDQHFDHRHTGTEMARLGAIEHLQHRQPDGGGIGQRIGRRGGSCRPWIELEVQGLVLIAARRRKLAESPCHYARCTGKSPSCPRFPHRSAGADSPLATT